MGNRVWPGDRSRHRDGQRPATAAPNPTEGEDVEVADLWPTVETDVAAASLTVVVPARDEMHNGQEYRLAP
jgi:hypothetical protein